MLTFTGGASLAVMRMLVVHDDAEWEFDDQAGAEGILAAVQVNSSISICIIIGWFRIFHV
jgi:hypothetical protein